ncbi:MAG: hypothetical protein ACI8X5_001254 [Planctomycetota bacterium]|jgi:hypothetical protein
MSALRIALSGSAGTGKTTLGQALAENLGVPYIEEGFRRRVDGGLQMYKLDDHARRELIVELWEEQQELEQSAKSGFVSDRSCVDFAAFWLHYGLTDAEEETKQFMGRMHSAVSQVDRILLFPWGVLPLLFDGVRSTNPWLQLRYQALLEGLHGMHTPASKLHHIPKSVEFDERLAYATRVSCQS